MRPAAFALAFAFIGFIVGAVFFIAASLVLAWTGPTSAPPSGNVSAPINVGTTDQIKNAGLGINSLAVFGNAILNGASRYLNFGTTAGSAGYGIRDNAGTLEFKSTGGTWTNLAGGATQQTTANCNVSAGTAGSYSCTTPSCPAGYMRSGCSGGDTTSATNAGAMPISSISPNGVAACTCKFTASGGYFGTNTTATCYAYCVH